MSTILIQALHWHKAGDHGQICSHYDQIMAHAMANPTDSEGCRLLIQMALIECQDLVQAPKHIHWLLHHGHLSDVHQLLSAFLHMHPEDDHLWMLLSNYWVQVDQTESAIEAIQKAIDLNPTAEYRMQLAHFYGQKGRHTLALQTIEAISESARNLRWLWLKASLMPVVFQDQAEMESCWNRCSKGLDSSYSALQNASDEECHAFLPLMTNLFSLQYLCHPDEVDLQIKYGRVLERLVERCFPQWRVTRTRSSDRPLRIGIVTAFFRKHTVTRLYLPLMRALSKGSHHIFGWSLDREDDWTPKFATLFQEFYSLSRYSLSQQAAHIASKELDVIFYPELGMNSNCLQLAALRLAPKQGVGWGHPVTTGLSTIDHFLSSEAMEPEDGDSFYSENMVPLSGLGLSLVPPVPSRQLNSIAPYPLPPASVRFLVSQSIFKILPEHDRWFARLMRQLPSAQLVFMAGEGVNAGEAFQSRIRKAFEAEQAPTDTLFFAPRLSHDGFLSLNLACDVFLDGMSWSGGMTTLEALQCGLVPLTMSGLQMRTRHTHAIVHALGLPELSVMSQDEWLAQALQLGQNQVLRQHMAERIREALPTLWRSAEPISDFEHWLTQVW